LEPTTVGERVASSVSLGGQATIDGTTAEPQASTADVSPALVRRRAGLGTLRVGVAPEAARGPAASMRRDSLFRRMLVGADALAVVGAYLITVSVASRSLQLTWAVALAVPIVIAGAKVLGLYDRDEVLLRKTTLDEAPKVFQLATMCALLTWFAGGAIVVGALDRHEALLLWAVLTVMLIAMRAVARALALRLAPAERCLFIGDADLARTMAAKLGGGGGVKASVVAHLDLDSIAPWSSSVWSPSRLAEIRELARELDVQRAIVAPRSADAGEVLDLVRTLKAVRVRVSVLPRLLEVVGSSVEFDDLQGMPLMGVRRFELTRSSQVVKRAFDLVCASLGLLTVSPLMLVIAIAIKLDSRGPVFFRQKRVGRHGEQFAIFKFRTMVTNAEELKDSLRERNEAGGGLFKIADDPRVTRVGRWLRKTALDEMPQLFNVLNGEMSLVGPRPLVVDEDIRVKGWHRRRLELTPGMTGPWQILGPARVPLDEMVAIDYLYVANWSLWNDAKIMLRTVGYVFQFRGL
jgi:exopolysaccharide biosynthesis polyprenyl glycosylphosphotransferase